MAGILSHEPHVTTGIITALAGIKDDTRFLQTSAPVQPGNSGGPLLDSAGNIVGL
ncbi:MAG: trypsin-like peptidase domain-containing protein [Pseudomonadota bacterium]|nr:trypsin-like peptidase domain-containing protein [Pseudomonadota bacterium]